MLIKAGVDISRLKRMARRGLAIVNQVYENHGEELVVTSTYEGDHGAGSLHYANEAFDVRKPKSVPKLIKEECAAMLGPKFDVVLEFDHIHIEHDPK